MTDPIAYLHYAAKKPQLPRVDFNSTAGADKARGWVTVPLGQIVATPAPAQPETAIGPWHYAVLSECMSTEGAYNPSDPVATLRALIDWHVANERSTTPTAEAPATGTTPGQSHQPWAMLTAPEKAAALIEELERTAERITRYSSNPLDGLLHAAADVLRELMAGAAAPVEGESK